MLFRSIQFPDGHRAFIVPNTCPKVIINEVEISVYPDCIITGTHRGNSALGAIKLYFGKNEPLTKDMGAYITTLTKRFLEENYQSEGAVRNQICQVIDVFGRSVFYAPTAYTRRINEIASACDEIKFWWNALSPNNQGQAGP